MGQCANTQITLCQGDQITLSDLFQNVVGTATITGFKRASYSSPGVPNNVNCISLGNSAVFPAEGGGNTTWTSTSTSITVAPNTFSQSGLNNFDIIVCGSDGDGVIGPCLLNVTVRDSDDPACGDNGGGGGESKLNCNTSFIDATEACNGRVLVCLQGADGTPYFDQFDIDGGPATNGAASTTGFTSNNNNPNYTQDYDVTDEPGFQCFFINYTVGTQTSDSLVIQPTETNNTPTGDACSLNFNVPTADSCNNTGTALTCGTSTFNVSVGQFLPASSFVSGGSPPYTVPVASGPLATQANTAGVTVTGPSGTSFVQITDSNGDTVTCEVTVNVADAEACIDIADSQVSVSAGGSPGQTINITADINPNSGGLAGFFLQVKAPDGSVSFPSFVPGSGNGWTWTVPPAASCSNGNYRICVSPPAGSDCPDWDDAASFAVTGCSDTTPCSTTITGATQSSTGSDPGDTVTISVPSTECNCAGYAPVFNDVTNYPADGSQPSITLNIINANTVSYNYPPNSMPGQNYQVHAKCCKTGA